MIDLYILLALLCVFCCFIGFFNAKISRSYSVVLCFAYVTLGFFYVGLRDSIGTDYENYQPIFACRAQPSLGISFNFLVNLLCSEYGPKSDGLVFLAVYIFYVILIFLCSKQFTYYYPFVFLYLFMWLFPSNMLGSLRQGLAVLLGTLGVLLLVRGGKMAKRSFVMAGATHTAGLAAAIPTLIVYGRRVFLPALLMFILLLPFLGELYVFFDYKLRFYKGLDGFSLSPSYIGKLVFIPFLLLGFICDRQLALLAGIFFIFNVSTGIVFKDYPVIVERLPIYFEVYKLLLLLAFINSMSRFRYMRLLIGFYFALLFLSNIRKGVSHFALWSDFFPEGIIF